MVGNTPLGMNPEAGLYISILDEMVREKENCT